MFDLPPSVRGLWYVRLFLDESSLLPASSSSAATVGELLPGLWWQTGVAAALFGALLWLVLPRLLAAAAPVWWAAQPPRDRRYACATLAALPHHVLVVAVSARALLAFPAVPAAAVAGVVHISLAYLAVDGSAALPGALAGERAPLEYLLHHALAACLTGGLLAAPPGALRWAPHVLICEASTLFFSAAWAARRAARLDLAAPLETAFAAVFFATRVVNLPLVLSAVLLRGEAASVGWAGVVVMAVVIAMQYMWFSQILATAGRRGGGGGSAIEGAAKTKKKG